MLLTAFHQLQPVHMSQVVMFGLLFQVRFESIRVRVEATLYAQPSKHYQ